MDKIQQAMECAVECPEDLARSASGGVLFVSLARVRVSVTDTQSVNAAIRAKAGAHLRGRGHSSWSFASTASFVHEFREPLPGISQFIAIASWGISGPTVAECVATPAAPVATSHNHPLRHAFLNSRLQRLIATIT
jgi:hypothetical protein